MSSPKAKTTTTPQSNSASLKCQQILLPPSSSTTLTSTLSSSTTSSDADNLLFQKLHQLQIQQSSNNTNTDLYNNSNHNHNPSPSPSPVWSCSWSHDGKLLATAHGRPDYPCIRIWSYENNNNNSNSIEWKLKATLRHDVDDDVNNSNSAKSLPRTIRAVEFAYTPPNVRYILACASFDGTVRIWEDFSSSQTSSRTSMNNYNHDNDTNNYNDHNNDDDYVAAYTNTNAGWENTAQLEGHENEVKDISWNQTGTLLATCGRDKTIWIWECFLPGLIGSQGNGNGNGISSNNIAGGGGQGDFECISILTSHTGDVKDVEFTSSMNQFGDGDDILLSASYDDTIKVWAEEDGEWYCALTLGNNVHLSTIWSIALSSSGVRMISASGDCSLGIWKFYTIGEKRHMISNRNNGDVNGRSNGNDKDGDDDVDMGNYSDGLWKCVGKLPNAHTQPIYTVHCAPSRAGHGRIVSGGGDDTIQIYKEVVQRKNDNNDDCENQDDEDESPLFVSEVVMKRAHDGDVNCVKWHPIDGSILASVGDDGLVKIWKYSQ